MKKILLSVTALTALAVVAANLNVSIPNLTTRQRDAIDWAMNTNNSGTTNVYVNRQDYINRVIEPALSNQVLVSWDTIIESLAQQRDNQEAGKSNKVAVLKTIRELLPTADTNRLAQVRAILEAP